MKVDIPLIYIDDPLKDARNIRRRTEFNDEQIKLVKEIMSNVAKRGDKALIEYSKKFDNVNLSSIKVERAEIEDAYSQVNREQIYVLKEIMRRIQLSEKAVMNNLKSIQICIDGIKIRKVFKPIESVGCYIPGGKARYPSTMLMCAIPAVVAGVKRIIACTPARNDGSIDPLTLIAADLCGIEVYRVGGAQAIAAMAYGTESIKPVSKIVGPGNIFVTIAKVIASDRVGIDMLAGPTELLVIADEYADPKFVALDLIAQAEHSSDTFCGLITCSKKFAKKVINEISKLSIERSEIVKNSLEKNGFIAICKNYDDATRLASEIAAEHVQVMTKNAKSLSKKIESAGLILVGDYTPAAASDYCFGTNHVLPTQMFARSRSSLSCLDFLRLVSIAESSKSGLKKTMKSITMMSEVEGLPNHKKAVEARFKASI